MLWKNHLTVWVGALPMMSWAGLSIFTQNPWPLAFYLMWLLANDMDWDWGNALMVKTFSFKIKSKGQPPMVMAPLAPVSMIIYHLFWHSAMMHYPEVWLLFSFLLYQLGLPLIWCYFFFMWTMVHLLEDWITVWWLPVPPTLQLLLVLPMSWIYYMVKWKPLKSIPMLWESKWFPPPGSDWWKVSFQDLIYENSLFFLPKFMSFKVWWPMETVAVIIMMTMFFLMLDPLKTLWTPSEAILKKTQEMNNVIYTEFQKSYDFLSFLSDNKSQFEKWFTDTMKTIQDTGK